MEEGPNKFSSFACMTADKHWTTRIFHFTRSYTFFFKHFDFTPTNKTVFNNIVLATIANYFSQAKTVKPSTLNTNNKNIHSLIKLFIKHQELEALTWVKIWTPIKKDPLLFLTIPLLFLFNDIPLPHLFVIPFAIMVSARSTTTFLLVFILLPLRFSSAHTQHQEGSLTFHFPRLFCS